MLKSVISASSSYRIMELGAGWGPATVAGLVLARLKGITDMHATAVEADPFHVGFLRQHVSDNAIPESAVTIFEAAVGVNDGVADWPDDAGTAVEYGNRPITADGDYLGRSIAKTRPVRIMAVDSLLTTQPQWDLLHIDIQGLEVETLTAAISRLNERVARICVGTHSRKIDGDLVALFIGHGWVMEHEKPTKMTYVPNPKTLEAMTSVDGTQVWRNPRLRPNPAV